MPQASIFRKKARERNYVERKASPYSIDIDTVIPLEVHRFEEVGETIAVVGRNVLNNSEVRIFRKWSRSPQNTRPNPLFAASQKVQPGGVMLFSGVEKLERSTSHKDYACMSFRTIAADPSKDATIYFGDAVFLDPPTTHRNRLTHQIYNVIQREKARMVRDQQGLVQALRHGFDTHSEDDSLLIRGVSRTDQIAGAVRVYYNPNEDFSQFLYRFRDAEHVIDLVGSDENTVKISGNEILAALDPQNAEAGDMTWEVIPVKGLRKRLSSRDPVRQADLEIAAKAQFNDFVIQNATTILGYHRSVVAVCSESLESGAFFDDIVAMLHDPGAPLPLAVVDTDHTPDLLDVLPNIVPKPIEFGEAGDYEVQDLEALLGSVAEEPAADDLDIMNLDILGALGAEHEAEAVPAEEPAIEAAPAPIPEAAPAQPVEPVAEVEAVPAAPSEAQPEATATVEAVEDETQEEDLLDFDFDLSEEEAPAPEQVAEDDLQLKVDLATLDAGAPEAAPEMVAAEQEQEITEEDLDLSLKIDLGALTPEAESPVPPEEAAEDTEDDFDLKIDIATLEAPAPQSEATPEPEPVRPAPEAKPAPAPVVDVVEATDPHPSDDGAIDIYTPGSEATDDFDIDAFMKPTEPDADPVSVASDPQDTPDDDDQKSDVEIPDEDLSQIFAMTSNM